MIWRIVDQIVSGLILVVGLAHVAVGGSVFMHPSDHGVWFISAGFLGVTAGLANWARARTLKGSPLLALAAFCGAASLGVIGGLLAVINPHALSSPPSLVVFVLSLVASVFSLRDLFRWA